MNNKDFQKELSERLNSSPKETQKLVDTLAVSLAELLEEGDSLPIQGFGTFEIRKKMERIVVNPITKQRQLVPPKLTLSFKAGATLKEKTK